MAGRDEYGGSNVSWYSSSSQQASVCAGTWLRRAARVSEPLLREERNWQQGGSRSGNYYQRHTAAAARESTVSRGL